MDLRAKSYEELLIWACPEPVTENNYERLLEKVDRLMQEGGTRPKTAIRKVLGVLTVLLEAYETQEFGKPHVSGKELLAYVIENRGETRAAFARAMGLRPQLVSNVLNGKRGISKRVAQLLGDRLHMDPLVFLVPDAEKPPSLDALRWEAVMKAASLP